VDFSHTLIFLTSILGAQEISKLVGGGPGYALGPRHNHEKLDQKIYKTATDAARRKFSPEFMNRIDKVIVFRMLNREHLHRILDIELENVRQRIISSAAGRQLVFSCTPSARDFLLHEGTDSKFGARHLKRSIERHLVFPLSNLLATGQIELGDLVTINCERETSKLTRVVINAALMRLRRRRRHDLTTSIDQKVGRDDLSLADIISDSRPNPEEGYAHTEWLQILRRTLRTLPPAYGSALWLCDVQGMSTREAAEALGVPVGSLKSPLHRARLRLRAEMGGVWSTHKTLRAARSNVTNGHRLNVEFMEARAKPAA
jgi:RNA polymerase sigma factor (sigma-70 family)